MSSQGFSYTRDQLREMAQDVLKFARKRGASACGTDVSEGFGQTVSVRKGEVDTIEYNRDKGIGVTVYLGQQRGYASTSDFSKAALQATADSALSTSPLITNSEGASTSQQESHFISANSLGFMGGYASSRHSVSCSVIAGEGDGMQRDDWYDSRRDPAELMAAEAIGATAARRAVARLKGRKIKTCEVPVIFEAPLAPGLIGTFVQAVSGGALYRKSSFLLDSLGQQVFSPLVQISERPFLPKAMGSSPFDDDGVATHDREVVVDGVLQGYFLGIYSARKLGMKSTGNAGGAHNLLVKPGDKDLDGLLKQMDRGLLVTEMLGHGVNYVTGDYSRGAAGFWVEKGKIKHPVEEITIAGNLKEMLRGIVAVGNDALPRGARHCGSLLIDRMTIAGE